ncbi:MAG TPA: sialate O-acetylesterase, partial [Phycisphaerae bacterium]|nr:sialate O-acetylesterase [Phycisphaerae bacterium]
MNRRSSLRMLVIGMVVLGAGAAVRGDERPFLSPMFGDHMVLQRGKENRVWGWTKAGETVKVTIGETSASARADGDGRWEARIEPPAAGGPYTVKVEGPESLELHDVLVGDVWLCGGQSNMELPLQGVNNAKEEIAAAERPEVRLFTVKRNVSYKPAPVVQGKWEVCTAKTAAGFSAVGYFFGSAIQEKQHVPVGLVEDCVGGTPAEAWMSEESLRGMPEFREKMAVLEELRKAEGPAYGSFVMHWYDQYDVGEKEKWSSPEFADASWQAVHLPGGFAELGVPSTPAVCWFRRRVTLPDPLPAGEAVLSLGSIERMETAWINGKFVGASSWVENPRMYPVGPGVLKPGENSIVLRVLKVKADGGFLSPGSSLKLILGDKTEVGLAGEWKGRLSVDARPPHPLPLGYENWPTMPAVLYLGMLKPVAPLSLTGAIWYQGEQNASEGEQYKRLLPAMIEDWRQLFDQGEFPFYIVSLPAFMERQKQPGVDGWTQVREAQIQTARAVANTGVAITVDTGEAMNIHPKDKRVVGERLALVALAKHYGEKVACEGPTYASMSRVGGEVRIHFEHAEGGLVVKGEAPAEFSVAGEDRVWHWAQAKVEGESVVVSSPEVP